MWLPSRSVALYVGLFAVGLTSTIGQLVLVRELTAAFYGNELVLGLILASWLAWGAVGSWGAAYLSSRSSSPMPARQEARMVAGLAAVAVLLPIQVALIRGSHVLLGVTPGALVPFGAMLGTIWLVLAPLCITLAWLFAQGARAVLAVGQGAGSAYAAESLGAVIGGMLFSFVLVRWLLPFQVVLGLGMLNLVAAMPLARQRWWLWGGGALTLALCTLFAAPRLDRATLGWQYDGLRFAQDSEYGRIVVTGRGEQRAFFESGMLFFETQGVTAEETVHPPLLTHPDPNQVLLIGGGVSGTLAEILHHPSVRAVTYVELDPLIISAARAELPPEQVRVLDDPRVTLVYVDGRVYVQRAAEAADGARYDVVLLDLPEPATGQLNRLYTAEFFALVKQVLSRGGILALSLPWQENYPGPALQRLGASVYHTLDAEFSEIVLLPGDRLFFLASEAPLVTDPAVLSARLAERAIETRWVVPSYLGYLYTGDRAVQARALLESHTGIRANRDLEPICYFYDLMVWLSRFYGSRPGPLVPRGWVLGGLVVVVLVAALSLRRWAVPAAVSFIGLAEMSLEVIVLLALQVIHGYVYSQVGVVVTATMVGLFAGSAVASRWRWAGPTARRQQTSRLSFRHQPRVVLMGLLGGIAVSALGLPLLVTLSPPVWTLALLALVTGCLTGLAFPVAVACTKAEAGREISVLYGADLAGGCIGAVLVSVLMVPMLGIPQTCLVVALVAMAGILVLV